MLGERMTKPCVIILAALVLVSALATTAEDQASSRTETVIVHNGSVTLHALLWRPLGHGHFLESSSIMAVAAPGKNCNGLGRTKNRLSYSDQCSLATDMCSCFSSDAELGCPSTKGRAPST